MSRHLLLIALSLLLICVVAVAAPLSPEQSKPWLRHLLPLPKQITFEGMQQVSPQQVQVVTQCPATGDVAPATADVAAAAAELLRKTLGDRDLGTGPNNGVFVIRLALCDKAGKCEGKAIAGAEKLAKLRNSEQAYVIVPDKGLLTVAALDERGLYHGAVTLSQLLPVKMTSRRVTVPLVRVVDWPDLAERGGWGGNMGNDTEWMSSVKLNLAEVQGRPGADEQGVGTFQFPPEKIEEGRLHAFKMVPIIAHLDQQMWAFERFPEIKGVGKASQPVATVHAICYSQPKATQLLSDWMVALAKIPHVTDVCIWLSEDPVQCECAACQAAGQFTLETRACVNAWRAGAKVNPDLKLRILLTQGSYKVNDKVLAEAPPEVNISYYDGGRTYDSSREPMIYPLLEDFAKSGRWLGVYPQITASWRIVCPWSGPQFIKYRMTEFVDKGLTNLCAYATPHNRLYDFNVSAAAEWSWNAHGRDEREFAAAWATRREAKDPEKVADWAVLLGPVGWDVYGSGTPYPYWFAHAGDMIKNRGKFTLGKGLYRYFTTEEKLKEDQAICERAAKMAAEIGDPWISAETQVISGYMAMLAKLYDFSMLISRPTPPSEAEREALNRDLLAFAQAGAAVDEGLRAWQAASLGEKVGGRLSDTIEVTDSTVARVSEALAPFGVRNPLAPYLTVEVGQYKTDEFEDKQAIRKVIEVTPRVSGAGTYQVKFTHTRGYNAATVQRVALACAPKDKPEQLTEVVSDKHLGVIGYSPTAPMYTLSLESHDEILRYFAVIDITGHKDSARPAAQKGCNGSITFWKEKLPGQEIKPLPLLPMTEAEKARYGGPKFGGTGVKVAVVQGGYGSESMLRELQGTAGVQAQPLYTISAAYLKNCQVVVMPQPKAPESYTPQVAALLAKFVADGGGLITTHNSVGYKGLPVAVPEVCVKGIQHFRDDVFRAAGDHPVVKGLPAGALRESYYDYITLQSGPAGTVVARGMATGEPVVVCGAAGKGKYVACGLGIGISAADDRDCALTEHEALLLGNAVKWAGGE
ncbi:MAG: glycoside hydrolase family 20 zincin-like fold domain-containing protein [Armatimonadota bacterium]